MSTILIDNKWREAGGGERIDVLNPCDAKVFTSISRGTAGDIDEAIAAARRALDGPWGKLTATERGRLMVKLSQLIIENTERIAQIEARDTGKPITAARVDVGVVARYFEFYGSAADKVHGMTIPFMADYDVRVERVPHGVTAHIIPWNYPAQMFGRTLAPALAMGNATVIKPSEDACLSGIEIAKLAIEAGFPPGAINLVTGYGHEAGAALTAHKGIDFATFTGSPQVGVMVQQATATNSIPCVLELGGKSPQIVFEDADIEKAAPVIVKAIVQNAGQTCSAGSRLLVQENVYEKFVAAVAERFAKTRIGSPDMDLDCGPIVNRKQLNRVQQFIAEATASGVPLIARGQLADGLEKDGYFVAPALFGPVPRDHALALDEVFGPVLSVIPFKDEEDAIALANGTDYGLVTGIWTENGGRAARVARRVHSGQVYINCYGAGGGVELPFGGVKRSGHGREKGFLAMEEMSTTKTIVHHTQ